MLAIPRSLPTTYTGMMELETQTFNFRMISPLRTLLRVSKEELTTDSRLELVTSMDMVPSPMSF